jgi:hypothetical protein
MHTALFPKKKEHPSVFLFLFFAQFHTPRGAIHGVAR